MKEFSNKVVVVTGGSSGIGLSIAQKFSHHGAKLAILGRDRQKLYAAAQTLHNVLPFEGDVSKVADLNSFYKEIHQKFGKIDVLVANAGIADSRPIHEVDEAFFDEMVNINYKGVYFTVQKALPLLNKNASIVLISSAAAHIGWPGHSVYSSTKAAVSYLAKSFSADLISHGIRINAVSPGFVDTPMFNETKATKPEVMQKLNENIPAHRFATAEEIANAVLFLSSSQAAYITGSDLIVDGGLSAIFPARL
jgi:NAD(P)-dependent dehydrogenase (short-subunit alcohol dehydrogenase family)